MTSDVTNANAQQKIPCADLLAHVQRAESMLPALSATYFGHPPPPETYIVPMLPSAEHDGSDVYLGAAVTKRCVSAQLLGNNVSVPSEPVEILCLFPTNEDEEMHDEPEEELTCATILTLDRSIKGSDSTAYASIVVGTSFSRILSVEVQIESDESGNLSLRISGPPFEPLPLDSADGEEQQQQHDDASVASMTSDTSSRHGNKRGRSDSFRDSQHSSPRRSASLSTSRHYRNDADNRDNSKPSPFCPSGGVISIHPYQIPLDEEESLTPIVWVAYGNGTTVRLHQGALFSSVVHDVNYYKILAKAALRSRVMLPPTLEGVSVLPLPKYHPSPLAPLPPWKPPRHDDDGTMSLSDEGEETDDDSNDIDPEFHEALVYGGDPSSGEQFPALAFYTSENQFVGRVTADDLRVRNAPSNDGALLDHVIGGTAALVGGVFGSAIGAVKWGLGRGDKKSKDGDDMPPPADVDMLDPTEAANDEESAFISSMYPALQGEQSSLFAGFEFHDSPRQITSASVDPDGNLVATTDTLGRVLLIDLDTKQVVRMFKGVREASCAWIEVPRPNTTKAWQKKKILYLAIHSQQRRTIDIYRMRHGPRVHTMQVGRDAKLIQSATVHEESSYASCYLLHSSAPGTTSNEIELLAFEDDVGAAREGAQSTSSAAAKGRPSSSTTHEAAMRLQLLQQLLAKTNVPSERQDVFEALTQITSLKDLSTALDVLAVASQLEDAMGVIGSEFHSAAVAHCKQTLENVLRGGGDDTLENAQVKLLASRIAYHSQLIDAYDVLHEFETKSPVGDDQDERVAPRSAWAVEAMAWLTMNETVTGTSVDADIVKQTRPVLPFWAFANACADSNQIMPVNKGSSNIRHHIHLTDSTKSRKEVLVHIFKPLLQDIFAFNVVSTIFDAMGIKDETDYLLKCFGDWFVSIPAREAARKGLFGLHSTMVRWLQDMVECELDSRQASTGVTKENGTSEDPLLQALYKFCSDATDLVRAFLLATLCREAVFIASKKKEAKTYGQISCAESVKPWNELLRKLRVCLLVSLRLNGMNLGAFPITVTNVESKDIFSVYEWLARDELTMSHKQDEVVSLENACKGSGLVFDPSSEAGDHPGRWKMLQQACLAAAISEEEREEYLLDMNDDDQLGALLLYLSHYNNPAILVAHRALLLARQWVNKPDDLQVLNECLGALRGLADDEKYKALNYAVRMEVWNSAIRPFYRAIFFGFDDVHELTEDVAGPLLDNREWVKGLGKVALPLLSMLSGVAWDESMNEFEMELPTNNTSWPPVKDDHILKRMVRSSRPVNEQALNIHRVIVCGTLVSDDMGALSEAVPELFECFLPTSLYQATVESTESWDKQQMEFLEQAVIDRANELEAAIPGRLDISDIETLARLWDVNLKDVRTLFLLAMYELGKDTLVDESLAACTTADLDVERFINDALGIACRRLNRVLNVKRSARVKSVMGMLDADTCEWIREQAEESMSLLEGDDGDSLVSLANTHLLVLRLLGLCTMIGVKSMASKIHSLSILSGTLLKALEQQE